jgi:hypothetical protein
MLGTLAALVIDYSPTFAYALIANKDPCSFHHICNIVWFLATEGAIDRIWFVETLDWRQTVLFPSCINRLVYALSPFANFSI